MTALIARHPLALQSDLDTELVLVSGTDGSAWRLNETGRFLWLELPATREDLVDRLTRRYDVNRDQAGQDIDATLTMLDGAGLLIHGERN